MSFKIGINPTSQSVINNLNNFVESTSENLVKLSSGKRITQAKDDAAGLGVATKLNAQSRSLRQAVRNANDGISMIQTTEGALSEITNNLVRMRELSIQSASDTIGDTEREFVNIEFEHLANEIDRVSQNAQFNGVPLLQGDTGVGVFNFHIGAHGSEDNIIEHDADIFDASVSSLDIGGLDVLDKDDSRDNLEVIDEAINTVGGMRAGLGGIQSRLHSSVNTLENQIINQDTALSRIEDVDVGRVTSEFAKNNIMQQVGSKALAQSHIITSNALKLIG